MLQGWHFFVRNLAAHAQIVTEAPTTYYLLTMDAILNGVLVDFSVNTGLINFLYFSVIFYFFHLSYTFLDFQVTRNIEIKTCGLTLSSDNIH